MSSTVGVGLAGIIFICVGADMVAPPVNESEVFFMNVRGVVTNHVESRRMPVGRYLDALEDMSEMPKTPSKNTVR